MIITNAAEKFFNDTTNLADARSYRKRSGGISEHIAIMAKRKTAAVKRNVGGTLNREKRTANSSERTRDPGKFKINPC